jgi:hypothetical protein
MLISMFDYLQKFNKLPKNIKDKASSPFVIKKIEELEERYGVDLAAFVMKYLVKDINDQSYVRTLSRRIQFRRRKSA